MFKLEMAKQYEDFFHRPHDRSFELLDGERKIMISAPHSVEQTRNGNIKYAEPQTGVLAKLLHDELDCPVIFKTRNCFDDANFDKTSPYKDALKEYILTHNIVFLIDLHQLAPYREVKINIGTGNFKNISDLKYINFALEAFTKHRLGVVQIGTPFDASYPYTISSYIASNCHIPCMQIELNSKMLWMESEECELESVFEALKEFVLAIESGK